MGCTDTNSLEDSYGYVTYNLRYVITGIVIVFVVDNKVTKMFHL